MGLRGLNLFGYPIPPLLWTESLKYFLPQISSFFHFCLASVDICIVIQNSQLSSSQHSIITKVLSFEHIFCHKEMVMTLTLPCDGTLIAWQQLQQRIIALVAYYSSQLPPKQHEQENQLLGILCFSNLSGHLQHVHTF